MNSGLFGIDGDDLIMEASMPPRTLVRSVAAITAGRRPRRFCFGGNRLHPTNRADGNDTTVSCALNLLSAKILSTSVATVFALGFGGCQGVGSAQSASRYDHPLLDRGQASVCVVRRATVPTPTPC